MTLVLKKFGLLVSVKSQLLDFASGSLSSSLELQWKATN